MHHKSAAGPLYFTYFICFSTWDSTSLPNPSSLISSRPHKFQGYPLIFLPKHFLILHPSKEHIHLTCQRTSNAASSQTLDQNLCKNPCKNPEREFPPISTTHHATPTKSITNQPQIRPIKVVWVRDRFPFFICFLGMVFVCIGEWESERNKNNMGVRWGGFDCESVQCLGVGKSKRWYVLLKV